VIVSGLCLLPAAVYLEGPELPPALQDAFEVPTETEDAHGNPIRQGTDKKTGLPLEIRHKATGVHFVFVPAGEFMMGSPEDEKGRQTNEGPVDKVILARPFYVGKYEVTVGQFKGFVQAASYRTYAERNGWASAWTGSRAGRVKGASWQKPGFDQTDDHPVTEVSCYDAEAFCEWISKGQPAKVTLPREDQWEYACRAGSKGRFFWGEDETKAGQYANVGDKALKGKFPDWPHSPFDTDDGYVFTSPVGKFRPNDFGLYDVVGNVMEWCEVLEGHGVWGRAMRRSGDMEWCQELDHEGRPMSDWFLRGGSWLASPQNCRSAFRSGEDLPIMQYCMAGFRVVTACEWLQ
jgi:formylglycine-generating enzyme required for sulfatase activity